MVGFVRHNTIAINMCYTGLCEVIVIYQLDMGRIRGNMIGIKEVFCNDFKPGIPGIS